MPLAIDDVWMVDVDALRTARERLRSLVDDGYGSDVRSLKNCITDMREAFDEKSLEVYWSGYAKEACVSKLEGLIGLLETSVDEAFGAILKELDLYIEVYEYVAAKAEGLAEQAADTVQQAVEGS